MLGKYSTPSFLHFVTFFETECQKVTQGSLEPSIALKDNGLNLLLSQPP